MILLDVNPNWVKPGWTPLIITIVLAGIMVFLFFSMRQQFRKINAAGAQLPTERSLRQQRTGAPSIAEVRIDEQGDGRTVPPTDPALIPPSSHD